MDAQITLWASKADAPDESAVTAWLYSEDYGGDNIPDAPRYRITVCDHAGDNVVIRATGAQLRAMLADLTRDLDTMTDAKATDADVVTLGNQAASALARYTRAVDARRAQVEAEIAERIKLSGLTEFERRKLDEAIAATEASAAVMGEVIASAELASEAAEARAFDKAMVAAAEAEPDEAPF